MSGTVSQATVDAVLELLRAAPEPMTAAQIAAAMCRSVGNAKVAIDRLRNPVRLVRIAGHLPHRGPRAAGRPATQYDAQVHLPDAVFVPLTPEQIRAGCRARINGDPVRREIYRDKKRDHEAQYDRPGRTKKPAPLPAFDPKTAINWKRAA